MKLARILGRAVEKIYGYGGRGSKNPGLAHMHHFLDELENWRFEAHNSFDISRCLKAEAPRDLLTLHMAYNQVCTLNEPDHYWAFTVSEDSSHCCFSLYRPEFLSRDSLCSQPFARTWL